MNFIPDLLLHFLSVRVQPLLTCIYDSEKTECFSVEETCPFPFIDGCSGPCRPTLFSNSVLGLTSTLRDVAIQGWQQRKWNFLLDPVVWSPDGEMGRGHMCTWSTNVKTKILEAGVDEGLWIGKPAPSCSVCWAFPMIGEGFTLHLCSYLLLYLMETVYCALQAAP